MSYPRSDYSFPKNYWDSYDNSELVEEIKEISEAEQYYLEQLAGIDKMLRELRQYNGLFFKKKFKELFRDIRFTKYRNPIFKQ